MLEVKNLSFAYSAKEVLEDISFSLDKGKFVSLLGANAVGKSTLFKCILGIHKNSKGKILLEDKDIKKLSSKEISSYFTYIPQVANINYNYKVIDIVLMGRTRHISFFSLPSSEDIKKAKEALKKFDIEDLENLDFSKLSGGQKQLVMLARAFSQESKIWILDEPCSNLDYGNQIKILRKLKDLSKQGYIIFISTHNPEQAAYFSDEVMVLDDKKLILKVKANLILDEKIIKKVYDIDVKIHTLENGKNLLLLE